MNPYREKAISRALDHRRRREGEQTTYEIVTRVLRDQTDRTCAEVKAAFAGLRIILPDHPGPRPIEILRRDDAVEVGVTDDGFQTLARVTLRPNGGDWESGHYHWEVHYTHAEIRSPLPYASLADVLDGIASYIGFLLDPQSPGDTIAVVLTAAQYRNLMQIVRHARRQLERHECSSDQIDEIVEILREAIK